VQRLTLCKVSTFYFFSFTVLNKLKAVGELKERLIAAWSDFRQESIDTVIDLWRKSLQTCVHANDGHFEHFL